MLDKTHFSFLIAFSRQLEKALTQDVDDDVSDAVESLGGTLGALLAVAGGADGEESGGNAALVEDEQPAGDGTPLGSAVERRLAALEHRAATVVDVSPRRIVGGRPRTGERMVLDGKRRVPAVLKKGKTRGKK